MNVRLLRMRWSSQNPVQLRRSFDLNPLLFEVNHLFIALGKLLRSQLDDKLFICF